MVFGLLVATGVADRMIRRGASIQVHRWLPSVALALVAAHVLVLTVDRFMRFDLLDLLVPFLSSYRRDAIGLGVLAAYGALAVHASFGLRRPPRHQRVTCGRVGLRLAGRSIPAPTLRVRNTASERATNA